MALSYEKLCSWAVAMALSIAGRVSADTAQQPATGSLEEIVVTAEKREAILQKSALTIQVLSGDSIQRSGIRQASDLQTVIPGLTIGVGGDNDQIFIRGVGSFAYSPISTPGVAFNVDGVYVGRPDGLGSVFYDVSQVEVLKGPQGTLYGRNANGGPSTSSPTMQNSGRTARTLPPNLAITVWSMSTVRPMRRLAIHRRCVWPLISFVVTDIFLTGPTTMSNLRAGFAISFSPTTHFP